MAARRLLIVMLVLLGLSTLAAALVPQHALRAPNPGTTTTTTTTTAAPTTTAATPSAAYFPPTKIVVGGKKLPVVSPLHVGDQISLHVFSTAPTQISIPALGLVGFASPNTPAIFELLPSAPGTLGVLLEPSGKVAAQIRVVSPAKPTAKSRAPAGSGRAR